MTRLAVVLLLALVAATPAWAQGDAARGRTLFNAGCAECHGLDAKGVYPNGPDLHGAGAAAADFYLSTGRMPLPDPKEAPARAQPAYPRDQIDDIVAYVGSFGGPAIPDVHPERGNLAEGFRLFADHCAGCHQIVAKGGIVPGAIAPPLEEATAREIAEAVRVGPYVMPRFDGKLITPAELDSLVRYVVSTRSPEDRGGWGLGNLGPVPEGLVAWLLAGAALVVLARLIGRRIG